MSKFVKFFALINACLSSLLAVSEISGLQHRQYRASEHRAEHSEILQDTGVYSTNRTSNIVRLFAKLVYWHRFHTRAPRVSPVTSFKLSSIELSCVGFDSAWYLFCVADSHMDNGMKFGTLYKYKARCVPWFLKVTVVIETGLVFFTWPSTRQIVSMETGPNRVICSSSAKVFAFHCWSRVAF